MEFFDAWINKGIIDRLSVWVLSVTIILLSFIWFILGHINFNHQFDLLYYFDVIIKKDVADKDVVQITYTEAIDLLSGANKKFEFPVTH